MIVVLGRRKKKEEKKDKGEVHWGGFPGERTEGLRQMEIRKCARSGSPRCRSAIVGNSWDMRFSPLRLAFCVERFSLRGGLAFVGVADGGPDARADVVRWSRTRKNYTRRGVFSVMLQGVAVGRGSS